MDWSELKVDLLSQGIHGIVILLLAVLLLLTLLDTQRIMKKLIFHIGSYYPIQMLKKCPMDICLHFSLHFYCHGYIEK